jgi:hypothetical protein
MVGGEISRKNIIDNKSNLYMLKKNYTTKKKVEKIILN